MEYTISKPIFETDEGCVVGIYDKRIHDAIKNKEYAHIISFWRGKKVEITLMPKWIKKNCKKIQKVYLRPDQPMTEYEIFIPKPKTYEQEIEYLAKLGVF